MHATYSVFEGLNNALSIGNACSQQHDSVSNKHPQLPRSMVVAQPAPQHPNLHPTCGGKPFSDFPRRPRGSGGRAVNIECHCSRLAAQLLKTRTQRPKLGSASKHAKASTESGREHAKASIESGREKQHACEWSI